VAGDPRSLPATVELSAYRIVEHLVDVLADQPDSRIEVACASTTDALGDPRQRAGRPAADVKAAVAGRGARQLLGGRWTSRSAGARHAVAQLPVPGSARHACLEHLAIAGASCSCALPTRLHGWPSAAAAT
jgi:hypothetical protein